MTNIFGTPEKHERKRRLFEIGLETLRAQGFAVVKVPGIGKSSVRKITKDGRSRMVAIRTTQDRWMSFPRNDDDTGWGTLQDVDLVMAVAVDDVDEPRFGLVHLFDQSDVKARFDRALAARIEAGHSGPTTHGMWISLYQEESSEPVNLVGAGAGLASPPIARVPLDPGTPEVAASPSIPSLPPTPASELLPLTIAEAKRRLALSLGVDPSAIKISVEA
jgi:hypothetical protein